MRCSVLAVVLAAISVAACHHAATTHPCHPVASWMAPAFACASTDDAAATEPPAPDEEVEAEAEPEDKEPAEPEPVETEPPRRRPIDADNEQAMTTKPVRAVPVPPTTNAALVGNYIEIVGAIEFEIGSSRLRERSNAILDDVAAVMRENPGIQKVQVAAHTDSTLPRRLNRKLSTKRAMAVRRYLISKGIAPQRLVAKGFGERWPIADNATEQGRQKNRRIVFKILKRK